MIILFIKLLLYYTLFFCYVLSIGWWVSLSLSSVIHLSPSVPQQCCQRSSYLSFASGELRLTEDNSLVQSHTACYSCKRMRHLDAALANSWAHTCSFILISAFPVEKRDKVHCWCFTVWLPHYLSPPTPSLVLLSDKSQGPYLPNHSLNCPSWASFPGTACIHNEGWEADGGPI
jgi:hypothetical protein